MHPVICELALVNKPVLEPHLSLEPLVIFPLTREIGCVRPLQSAVTFSLASFEGALVSGLFVVLALRARQAILVLEDALTARSAILELPMVLVTVLEFHDATPKYSKLLLFTLTRRVCLGQSHLDSHAWRQAFSPKQHQSYSGPSSAAFWVGRLRHLSG